MDDVQPGAFPPPPPFRVETDVEAASWIDEGLLPFRGQPEGVLVGEIVPAGFDAYARLFHPAQRSLAPSIGQSTPLRWSEIAATRGKTVHSEMQVEALMDNRDSFDYDHWTAASRGRGEWAPPHEGLEETEAFVLAGLLGSFTGTPDDAWFMLWDGYGDLGPNIEDVPRAFIQWDRSDSPVGELKDGKFALRHYLVFRGPLNALATWFRWRMDGPNYWWPNDRTWIVATEIDGFSTYVGASAPCIEGILTSPLLEALSASLDQRFDVAGDKVNWPPKQQS